MSSSFVVALFVAMLMVVFWRVVVLAAIAFLLAALLVGAGLIHEGGASATEAELQRGADAPAGLLLVEPRE